MEDSKKVIPIVGGWRIIAFCVGDSVKYVPNDRMLINFVNPGCNPDLVKIHWLEKSELNEMPDREKESQLNLRECSNSIINYVYNYLLPTDNPTFLHELSCLIENFYINNVSDDEEALYHLSVSRYISWMLSGDRCQNREELIDLPAKITSTLRKSGWDGVEKLAEKVDSEVSEYDPTSDRLSLIGREYNDSSELEERFPDYKIADDYLENLIGMIRCKEEDNPLLSLLDSGVEQLLALPTKRDTTPLPRQCPYCQEWHIVNNFNNGKISSICKKKNCQNLARKDRSSYKEKRQINSNIWKKDPNYVKPRRCKTCHEARMLSVDKICKKCFNLG